MKKITRSLIAGLLAVLLLSSLFFSVAATELKTGIGIVDASALRLRAGASTESEIISTAFRGDSVVIIREVGDWYLVNFNLDIGYMYKEYVQFKEKENVKLGFARFDCTSNVRKGPGTDTGIVAQAPKNETCFIIGFNTGWYKVSFNGQIGYVRSDLLTLLEKPYSNKGSLGNTYHEDQQPAAAAPAETAAPAPAETAAPAPAETSAPAPAETTAPAETAAPAPAETSAPAVTAAPAASSLGQQIANFALQFEGYRYVYSEESPERGFDCSGLTWYVAKHFGFSIGRTADQQLSAGSYVSRADLQPGDIVLFERTYVSSERATHAGIYIGNGKFIHAANSKMGVVISELATDYYSSRFICGRRLG